MADAYTTFLAMSNDAPNVYIANRMTELLERNLVLEKICDAYPLEQKMSKTLRAVRVKRLALPSSELVEGVTPSTNALELEYQEVTVKQWGIVVLLTDVVELTVKHPMLAIAIERVAMAMKETQEREAAQVLMGGTNVSYPGAVTARSGLAATDVMTSSLIFAVVAKLKMRGAPKYSPDGQYMGVMQPPHTFSILSADTVFQQASNFARVVKLEYGYLGPFGNVDWIEGNFLPQYIGVAAATTAAATATKAQYTVGTSGSLATANYQLVVVGRELVTDYERRLSVQTGNISVTSPGNILVNMPTSVNYSYDVYMTLAGGTVPYKVASRIAAGGSYNITTAPVGTEAVAPVSPALGVPVYPGWVFGKGALGITILNGMSLQTFSTPKGPSDSDPLAQRKKVGAKYMQNFWIVDQSFLERFETSSSLAPAIPA